MKSSPQNDVERLLRSEPTAAPPAGLAEKIKAEIPYDLEIPAPAARGRLSPWRAATAPGRRFWALAASLVMVVGGGFIAWRVTERRAFGPVGEPGGAPSAFAPIMIPAPRSSAAPQVAPLAVPPGSGEKVASAEERDRRRAAGVDVDQETQPSGAQDRIEAWHQRSDVHGNEAVPLAKDESEAGARFADATRPEPVAPLEVAAAPAQKLAVLAESPLLDAAAQPAKPKGSLVANAPSGAATKSEQGVVGSIDGRVEGGVEGGVPGGVPGGVVGGVPGGVVGGLGTSTGATVRQSELGKNPTLKGRPAASAPPAAAPQRTPAAAPSTGGTAEPNDQAYGDMFFRPTGVNPFVDTDDDRLSTFGLDVDTGSYTLARSYLERGHLPPAEAIRVEELVNFFDYREKAERGRDFTFTLDGAPTPFTPGERYRLVRFHLQARPLAASEEKPADLIFVVDVSGSMADENRLELVKQALVLLLDEMGNGDRVGLVVFGSHGRVVLEPTSDHGAIRSAVESLHPEGSTNAEEGIRLAYELADRTFRSSALRRLILCSDGVANVGATGPESILARIAEEARRGVELTTVGVGMGNYNDALMEQLADQGDGRYHYVDSLAEARRVFVDGLAGTLATIARDAKAQVEFDPAVVARWRLLGYENRDVADEKFRDDRVDAGEIGAGHQVTALYEIKLQPDAAARGTVATLHLRYRRAADGKIVETAQSLALRDLASSWRQASPALRLAACAGELAELLKRSFWAKDGSFAALARELPTVVRDFRGDAAVTELAELVARAERLSPADAPREIDER